MQCLISLLILLTGSKVFCEDLKFASRVTTFYRDTLGSNSGATFRQTQILQTNVGEKSFTLVVDSFQVPVIQPILNTAPSYAQTRPIMAMNTQFSSAAIMSGGIQGLSAIYPTSNKWSNYWDQAAPVLNNMANGLMNSQEQVWRNAEAMKQVNQAMDMQKDFIIKQYADVGQSVAQFSVLQSGAALVAMANLNFNFNEADIEQAGIRKMYEKMQADPFVQKSYDLDPMAEKELAAKISDSIRQQSALSFAEHLPLALQQISEDKSKFWQNKLIPYAVDGVIQTQVFTNGRIVSPLDQRKYETDLQTAEGQAVRQVMNRAQVLWISESGFANTSQNKRLMFLAGAATASSADHEFTQGSKRNGYQLIKLASDLLDSTIGVGEGLILSAADTVKMIPQVGQALNNLVKATLDDPDKVAQVAVDYICALPNTIPMAAGKMIALGKKFVTDYLAASPREQGRMAGKLLGDVIIVDLAAGAIKGLGVVAGDLKAASNFKSAETFVSSVGLDNKAVSLSNKAVAIANSFTAIETRRQGLQILARTDSALASEVLRGAQLALENGSPNAADFLGKVLSAKAYSPEAGKYLQEIKDVNKVVNNYLKIEKLAFAQSKFDGEITRAVDKSLKIPDPFQNHPKMTLTDHRFPMGGEEGSMGINATIGISEDSKRLAAEEARLKTADAQFSSRNYKSDKVLDLTKEENIRILKSASILETDLVRISSEKDAYLFTQIIGDVAKKQGFEAIIFESQFKGKNIVIISEKPL